ncbi:MAG: hypothetical protein GOVbin2833_30 [Prokaryotic dsDNA virus sp.]|nr:MAG: hypothetical protein GOVbin2833_30 [Prokaryotic dsDNA virus sp.]|tara:strand:- start:8680 stop:9183 length:504 start_codon:yes stop_codon:yes gene_type:complete
MRRKLTINQHRFLAAYVQCGTVSGAARAANVARKKHYEWQKNELYAEAFEEADAQSKDTILEKCRELAMDGNVPLLVHLSKALHPRLFANRHEISGPDGGDISVRHGRTTEELLETIRDRRSRIEPIEDASTGSPKLLGGSSNKVSGSQKVIRKSGSKRVASRGGDK